MMMRQGTHHQTNTNLTPQPIGIPSQYIETSKNKKKKKKPHKTVKYVYMYLNIIILIYSAHRKYI